MKQWLRRRSTPAAGEAGERAAAVYLVKRGYRLLRRNWRCPAGEIDLIMEAPRHEGGMSLRVLVEVRTRQISAFGSAVETVAYTKQHRLRRAAQWYQQTEGWWGGVRFDVVAITIGADGTAHLEHIADAFMA